MELEALNVVLAGRFIPRSRDDADNGGGRRVLVEGLIVIDVAPDRVLPGEIFLGQGLIDNDRARPARDFFRTEGSSAQDRHSHGAEVVGGNDVDLR
jgi:hypothetical protein